MKRFNKKSFIKTGILEKLKARKFIKGNENFMFYMWDYQKGAYYFHFRHEKDIEKSFYEKCEHLVIQLYYQHIDDYADTFEMICNSFDKVELLKGEK